MTNNVNLNATKCIVHQDNIGEKIVHNICSGDVTIIPWTIVDWMDAAMMGVLGLFILAMLLFIVGFVFFLIYDFFHS